MDISIRFANQEDKTSIFIYEDYLQETRLSQMIQNNEILFASFKGNIVGYLRYQLFWSKLPYLTLIKINLEYQRRGIGKSMLQFLERHLISLGFHKLLSSSTANEQNPQLWHKSVGFIETGFINGLNQNNIGEIFFTKELK